MRLQAVLDKPDRFIIYHESCDLFTTHRVKRRRQAEKMAKEQIP